VSITAGIFIDFIKRLVRSRRQKDIFDIGQSFDSLGQEGERLGRKA